MKIGIASDHRGYILKQKLIKYLEKKYQVKDYGTNNTERTDYPIYAFALSNGVLKKEVDFGIAICGTGIGISIACNKIRGIYCAKIDNIKEAKLSKEHNNANIIAFKGTTRFKKAKKMIDSYIEAKFLNQEPHLKRISLIKEKEK